MTAREIVAQSLATLAVLAAVVAATGLIAPRQASAQLPGLPCHAGTHGWSTQGLIFSDMYRVWILSEFQCARKGDDEYLWVPTGWPLARFGAEKPSGWYFSGDYDSGGYPRYVSPGTLPIEEPSPSYWDADVSLQIQRGISGLVYAGDICASLSSGEATGTAIDPAQVYLVDGNWHHIPDADDRAALGRPDARMSSIWGYRSEFYDHDDDPDTPKRERRVKNILSCATE